MSTYIPESYKVTLAAHIAEKASHIKVTYLDAGTPGELTKEAMVSQKLIIDSGTNSYACEVTVAINEEVTAEYYEGNTATVGGELVVFDNELPYASAVTKIELVDTDGEVMITREYETPLIVDLQPFNFKLAMRF